MLLNYSAAGGYIIRDWTGKLLKVGANPCGHTSILVAKVRALRDGIEAALQARFTKLCTEGDNLIVMQALTGKSIVLWKIGTIIEDLHIWLQQATQVHVSHIFREENMTADWLSKFGHTVTASVSSYVCFSLALDTILAPTWNTH